MTPESPIDLFLATLIGFEGVECNVGVARPAENPIGFIPHELIEIFRKKTVNVGLLDFLFDMVQDDQRVLVLERLLIR